MPPTLLFQKSLFFAAMNEQQQLKKLLDEKADLYNQPGFIAADPICIPHEYQLLQDVEITGFFAAVLAWGNRTTIINNCRKLFGWMDNAPYDFILHHQPADLKPFLGFVHRTFNATDLLYFIEALRLHYTSHASLEDAFVPEVVYHYEDVQQALIHFHRYFFAGEHPERTRKHIATPERKSACKRLNMYLRWMVRQDDCGVDFGLWKKLQMSQLVCPLDVHVARVAHRLGLIENTNSNWENAKKLTQALRQLDPADPARYDYALFGLGMAERL